MLAVGRRALLCWSLVGLARGQEEELSPEEYTLQLSEAQMTKLFKVADKDQDGKVLVRELHEFAKERRQHMSRNPKANPENVTTFMDALDSNKDGKVELKEALEGIDPSADHHIIVYESAKFEAADKNDDGFLDRQELAAFEWPETDEAVERAFGQALLDIKDTNQDGALDIAEFFAPEKDLHGEYQKDFKALDKNGDGKLTLDETVAYESGRHYVEQAMEFIASHADTDQDGSITLREFLGVRGKLESTDAGYHLEDWAQHFEI